MVSSVNSEPGVVVTFHNRVVTVIALTCAHSRVTQIHAIGNPDKLAHVTSPRRPHIP
jgi:hypothetical protein